MKKRTHLFLCLLTAILILSGCHATPDSNGENSTTTNSLGGFDDAFGEELSSELYEGYFEAPTEEAVITCLSGTPDCYTWEGSTLTFGTVTEDSVYAISGQLKGNIVIDVGDGCKFDLELHGFSLVSDTTNSITILSGDEVSVTAKKDFENYIYDMREAIDKTDETLYSAAIYSLVDLEIAGKGTLTVVSENNNGIHTKDDLQVKNLTLTVTCADNALKGNDSVTLEAATTKLISTVGDGIKTTNTDVSEKGNQRGTVTVIGGTHTIYAACDGIDAAYNVVIEDSSTVLNIYTDKYSNYSDTVTAVSEDVYYIRFSSNSYRYSVKYYNSDSDFVWVNAAYHSSVSGRYYYYTFPKMPDYSKMQFFIYDSSMEQSQADEYLASTDYVSPSEGYDTFAFVLRGNNLSCGWTNYTTQINNGMMGGGGMGGMGGMGMNDGNTDKGDHSTKGLKAGNEIVINDGNVTVKAYDDAIHANCDSTLENGDAPTGNVTVNGGNITVYSNDDGLHADGTLSITNGTVSVTNSYEGLEGTHVSISGGQVSVVSSDDGINGTATTGTAITVSGGTVYIYCNGDGIDSNSQTQYSGIVFSGGNTIVISTSNGNSAIDTERGYQYTGGSVVAIMPSGGISEEATKCSNFSTVGTNKTVSLGSGSYLTVKVSGETVVTLKIPSSISGRVIYLGSSSAEYSTASSTSLTTDHNGVCWKES
ncbi:MAG: carbohydrate-binding domain-containing protein [Clostridia bacterium]|nr:carbohydrate-binding domain-containing protein [Clostridia bacterium]